MPIDKLGPSPEEMGLAKETKKPPVRVESSKEEYGTIQDMLLVENFADHFDEVVEQVEKLRLAIEKYRKIEEARRSDPDMDVYSDETMEAIDRALKKFEINGKIIDLTELSGTTLHEDVFNDLVYSINDYNDNYPTSKRHEYLNGI